MPPSLRASPPPSDGAALGGDVSLEEHPSASSPKAIASFSRDDLVGFQQRWLRPDNMELFVVSNLPLGQVAAQLEQRFGNWQAPAVAKGAKSIAQILRYGDGA